jgi:hypothetical protein
MYICMCINSNVCMCVYVYLCIYATCHIGMSPEVYGRFLERQPPIQLPKPVPTNKPDLKTIKKYLCPLSSCPRQGPRITKTNKQFLKSNRYRIFFVGCKIRTRQNSGLPSPAFYCMRISIGIYRYISINTATSDLGSGLPRPAFYCVRISIGIYRYTSVYIDKYRMYAYMVYT